MVDRVLFFWMTVYVVFRFRCLIKMSTRYLQYSGNHSAERESEY